MIATNYRYVAQSLGIWFGHPVAEARRLGVRDLVALITTGALVDEVVASLARLARAHV